MNESLIGCIVLAAVSGVEFDLVALINFVQLPALFLPLPSLLHKGRRSPPAYPVLTIAVSLI